jgi:hypothetical protein
MTTSWQIPRLTMRGAIGAAMARSHLPGISSTSVPMPMA